MCVYAWQPPARGRHRGFVTSNTPEISLTPFAVHHSLLRHRDNHCSDLYHRRAFFARLASSFNVVSPFAARTLCPNGSKALGSGEVSMGERGRQIWQPVCPHFSGPLAASVATSPKHLLPWGQKPRPPSGFLGCDISCQPYPGLGDLSK